MNANRDSDPDYWFYQKRDYRDTFDIADPESRSRLVDTMPYIDVGRQQDQYGGGGARVYQMDHLATFTVGKAGAVLFPEDGIKKLRQMEERTGVWTMRCRMVLDRKTLFIFDGQSREEIDRFDLQYVSEPWAMMNTDRRDIYNNIVLFTVSSEHESKRSSSRHHESASPPEMHLFQCISHPAQEVVEDMRSAKTGRPSNRENHSLQPLQMPPEYHPTPHSNGPTGRVRRSSDPATAPASKPHSNSSKNDFYVEVLNNCFDDIEKFVSRLQQAADSFKELERRKKLRKGGNRSNSRSLGDGMLTMRARPPPQYEFVEVFQKFKLSFNLLAALKSYIHDPNAPELVHFLCTPLSLIVEASRGTNPSPASSLPEIASRVISPLLTREAKELLLHCLTSKEWDLWVSLGESWTLAEDQWPAEVPAYRPRFNNGFQPSPYVLEEVLGASVTGDPITHPQPGGPGNDGGGDLTSQRPTFITESEKDLYSEYHSPYDTPNHGGGVGGPNSGAAAPNPAYYPAADKYRSRPDEDRPQQRRQQQSSGAPPPSRGGPSGGARTGGRPPSDNDSIDSIDLIPSSSSRNPQDNFLQDLITQRAKIYVVTHSRTGANKKELSVEAGDIIEVLDDSRNWWNCRNFRSHTGYVPFSLLKPYSSSSKPNSQHDPENGRGLDKNNGHVISSGPSSGMRNGYSSWRGDHPHIGSGSRFTPNSSLGRNSLQMERLNLHRASELFFDANSSPEEIQLWLSAKGFSNSCIARMGLFNGKQLLEISRKEINRILDPEEAQRLWASLQVVKRAVSYAPTDGVELKEILLRRRKTTDRNMRSPRHQAAAADERHLNNIYHRRQPTAADMGGGGRGGEKRVRGGNAAIIGPGASPHPIAAADVSSDGDSERLDLLYSQVSKPPTKSSSSAAANGPVGLSVLHSHPSATGPYEASTRY